MIYINVIVINNPLCLCGKTEDVYHFFFSCKNYSRARHNLFDQLFMLDFKVNIDTSLLLYGNDNLPLLSNLSLFKCVYQYIF